MLYAAIVYFISELGAAFIEIFLSLFLNQVEWYFIIYWSIIVAGYSFEYYQKFKQGELDSISLEAELMKSQLQALKMQLQPHFLFNTLNNISSLVRQGEKQSAVLALSGISELLRITLAQKDQHEITLEEEVSFIKKYLEIEEIRFKDNLKIEYSFQEEALQGFVPSFILQPIVENAINHGLSKKIGAKRIELHASIKNETLLIEIFNEGPALKDGFNLELENGIGLKATKDRLTQMFTADYSFELSNKENGVLVSLNIPFKTNKHAKN